MRKQFDVFFEITARWQLTQTERRTLLGSPTNERWFHLVRDAILDATPDEMTRVRMTIQIDTLLSACTSSQRHAIRWFHTIESRPPFLRRRPLALLLGGINGFAEFAEHLKSRGKAL